MNITFALIVLLILSVFALGLLFGWRWSVIWICIVVISASVSYFYFGIHTKQQAYPVWLFLNLAWDILLIVGIVKAARQDLQESKNHS